MCTHTLISTLHYTCCYDEIKGNQDLKICSLPLPLSSSSLFPASLIQHDAACSLSAFWFALALLTQCHKQCCVPERVNAAASENTVRNDFLVSSRSVPRALHKICDKSCLLPYDICMADMEMEALPPTPAVLDEIVAEGHCLSCLSLCRFRGSMYQCWHIQFYVYQLSELQSACTNLLSPQHWLSAVFMSQFTASLPDHVFVQSHTPTLTHSHTMLITCTCCDDQIKGTQDKDFSYSFFDSLSLFNSVFPSEYSSPSIVTRPQLGDVQLMARMPKHGSLLAIAQRSEMT